jgi:AcrR family transcriptional regulator
MDTRERVLEVTAELLAASPTADISTRAVCEAAGIGAPLIYRQFGDKDGLLAAVVDHAFGKYLAAKRAAEPSVDPVLDLRNGWDTHIAFAVDQPNIYRLMFSARATAAPDAVEESFRLLRDVLERCAGAGRLRVSVSTAAQMIMSATVGVALSLIARPAQYPDDEVSARVRDALLDTVLTPAAESLDTESLDTESVGSAGPAASALAARLRQPSPSVLTGAESDLMQEWLRRIADAAVPNRA